MLARQFCSTLWRPIVVLALICLQSQLGTAAEPLNVLFIAADDLRCDLGCLGHEAVLTPNLDALAQHGRLFTRAYCQQAVCNPSRASLLCGLRPDTLRIWDLPTHLREVRPQAVTLPQHFKQQGYFTQNIGKIFHNWRQKTEGDPESWSVPAVMHYATHGSDKPLVQDGEELPPDLAQTVSTERRDVPDEAYFDGRIAQLAVTALQERRDRKQPFFLAVGFWKPHLPFNPPQRYWNLYDRDAIPRASRITPPDNVPPVALHNGQELLKSGRVLSEANIQELRHGYLSGISFLDAQVGKVLSALDALDLRKNTVIVFWSDHGFHLGEHGLWCKTSNFELDARVPLIISVPGMPHPGVSSNSLVELLDIYPTLNDVCGLPPRAELEGVSLQTILQDPAAEVKPFAATQHPRPAYYTGKPEAMGVSIRTTRFRYTEWHDFDSGDVQASELYDHDADPDETVNSVTDPRFAEILKTLREQSASRFPRIGYALGN